MGSDPAARPSDPLGRHDLDARRRAASSDQARVDRERLSVAYRQRINGKCTRTPVAARAEYVGDAAT